MKDKLLAELIEEVKKLREEVAKARGPTYVYHYHYPQAPTYQPYIYPQPVTVPYYTICNSPQVAYAGNS